MTGPTQNTGTAAQGLQMAQMLLDGMTMTLMKVGASTPLGQAIAKAITDIGKHVPPGAASPQGVSNAMKQMALKHTQMQPHQAAMGGGAPPPPGAGGMPPPGGASPVPPRPAA